MHMESVGFAPIARADAQILILGSLPGQRSIDAGEYYAHPQNAFWTIMRSLTCADGDYDERCQALLEHKIALWDVLASSVRAGSMDSAIQMDTAKANNFQAFLTEHRDLRLICCNGRKAAQLYARLVAPEFGADNLRVATLPSTSPAYAAMTVNDKLAKWRSIIR